MQIFIKFRQKQQTIFKQNQAPQKNPTLVKLVELKERFRKNEKYLVVYLISDRRINNGPTYVYKTSQIYHEIASELNINSGHLMRSQFVNFDLR